MKRYTVITTSQRHYVIKDNTTERLVEDYATPSGDQETLFTNPHDAMKLCAKLNADPDMPKPQTEWHRHMGDVDWNNMKEVSNA